MPENKPLEEEKVINETEQLPTEPGTENEPENEEETDSDNASKSVTTDDDSGGTTPPPGKGRG